MKKLLMFLLIMVLVVSIVGCAAPDEEDGGDIGENGEDVGENGDVGDEDADLNGDEMDNVDEDMTDEDEVDITYQDGTYDAQGEAWEHGNEDATVVIEDGKITEVTLRRLNTEGEEVNYEEWTGEEIDGKTRPNLKQFKEDFAERIIEAQSYQVDSISGATVSSENWKLAVKRALDDAASAAANDPKEVE